MKALMVGIAVGALAGWVVLERPQWVSDGIAYMKKRLFGNKQ